MKYFYTMLYLLITIGLQNYFIYAQTGIDNSGNPIKSLKGQEINGVTNNDEKKSLQNFKDVDTVTIINRIPSPSSFVADLAFDGEYLWVEGYNDLVIYKISPVDGSIIKTIPTSVVRPYGLAFDNQYLWLVDTDNYVIQKIDTATGVVVQSFPAPSASTGYPTGLAWDGTNLWNNDTGESQLGGGPDLTFQIDNTGQILQTFSAIGAYPSGLAWDGQYLWTTDNAAKQIHQVNPTYFNIIQTIAAPGGNYPNGLAWDGQYLWVSNNDADSIYQLDVGLTGIEEDELGDALPNDFALFQNYPNPFNPSTVIRFDLPEAAQVIIKVYNLLGKETQVLMNEYKQAGSYRIDFDGTGLPSGVYFYSIISGSYSGTKKMILLR